MTPRKKKMPRYPSTDAGGGDNWTNYQTWNVARSIFLNDDTYRYWIDEAKALFEDRGHKVSTEEMDAILLALPEKLESDVRNTPILEEGSLYSDLLGVVLSNVNWYEIAKRLIDELGKR